MPKETKPPRIPESRDVLWKSLRVMRVATARQLAAVCERPKNSVQVDLRRLVSTGYLRVETTCGRIKRDLPHTLIRDTGPKPPMFVIKDRILVCAVDRNTREIFGIHGGDAPKSLDRRANWMPKAKPSRGLPLVKPRRSRSGRVLRKVVSPYMQWKSPK